MSNVIDINKSIEVYDAESVLEYAKGMSLEDVLILGFDDEGRLYVGTSIEKVAEANFLLDLSKQYLLETAYE